MTTPVTAPNADHQVYAANTAVISGYSKSGNPALDARVAAIMSGFDLPTSMNLGLTDTNQVGGVSGGKLRTSTIGYGN